MSLCQWYGFLVFQTIVFPALWISASYITTISRINQDIKAPDIMVVYDLISGNVRCEQLQL